MNKCQGSSGLSLLIALAIICFILFNIAPKYLKNTTSTVKTEATLSSSSSENSKKSIPYVDTYNKGMAGARAAVEASKERNKNMD